MALVRVRYAPSPTGSLHVGNARTALFNWLFARRHGGRFVVRFEDTDTERAGEEAARAIIVALRWLGLTWDEGPEVGGPYGPYFQSMRLDLYRRYAERLLLQERAYECYCTPEELEARRRRAQAGRRPFRYEGTCRHLTDAERAACRRQGRRPALRLMVPDTGTVEVHDRIKGTVSFDNAVLDDFVIMKSDGWPTYNFACVVDDHEMRISHVIRAEEHLSNTPKQLHVYRALEAEPPEFAHLPMVLAPDRSKLSKRHGATAVEEYRQMGILPQALLNYLLLLGWSYDGTTEIISLEEASRIFDLDRVNRTNAVFDEDKLLWMNHQYIKTARLHRLARLVVPRLAEAGVLPDMITLGEFRRLRRILALIQERMHTLNEAPALIGYFFGDDVEYDPAAVARRLAGPEVPDILERAADNLAAAGDWKPDVVEQVIRDTAASLGVKAAQVIHPVRVAVTGVMVGPGLFDVLHLVGRERTIRRLRRAAARLRAGELVATVAAGPTDGPGSP